MNTRKFEGPTAATTEESVLAGVSKAEIEAAATAKVGESTLVRAEKTLVQALPQVLFGSAATTSLTHPVDVKNTKKVLGIPQTSFKDNFVGFKYNLAANLLKSSVLFGSMPTFKKIIRENMETKNQFMIDVLGGICSMALEGIVWSPFSYANMKMRIDHSIKSYWQALTAESPKNTVRAIGRGAFVAGALRNPIFAAIFFGAVQEEEQLDAGEKNPMFKIGKTVTTGALAGMFAGLFSYPLDVAQKLVMADPNTCSYEILKRNWSAKGYKAFFKGIGDMPVRMGAYSAGLGLAIAAGDSGLLDGTKVSQNIASFFNHSPSGPTDFASSEEKRQACVDMDYTGNRPF